MRIVLLAHAGDLFQDFFPVLFLAAGAYVVMTVLKEGAAKKDGSRVEGPTNPLADRRFKRQKPTAPSTTWGAWDQRRFTAPPVATDEASKQSEPRPCSAADRESSPGPQSRG